MIRAGCKDHDSFRNEAILLQQLIGGAMSINTTAIPIPSMYGILTYIYLYLVVFYAKFAKCRDLYSLGASSERNQDARHPVVASIRSTRSSCQCDYPEVQGCANWSGSY